MISANILKTSVFRYNQMNGQAMGSQRLPVAMETLDEPLYVNAKQYHRIIKRRQARAKLEAEGKIPKTRKVSLFAGLHKAAVAIIASYMALLVYKC